jgi:predicted nucleotidyltransferase
VRIVEPFLLREEVKGKHTNLRLNRIEALAHVLNEWATPLPIESVYVFGSIVRGDDRPGSDLDVAVQFDPTAGQEAMHRWVRENETDFSSLKMHLGYPLSLHADSNDAVWPIILSSQTVYTIGKVTCVLTPSKRALP